MLLLVISFVLYLSLSSFCFGALQDEKVESESSGSEDDNNSTEEEEDNDVAVLRQQEQIGNHVLSPIISSTPMVPRQVFDEDPQPSTDLVSTRMDPGLGPSGRKDDINDDMQKNRSDTTPCDDKRTYIKPVSEKGDAANSRFRFTPNLPSTSFPQPFNQSMNRPSFKVSSFMSSRPSISPSTKISPFYKGVTSFGGSSALRQTVHKRQKLSPVSSTAQTTRTQIKPKSFISKQQGAVTSDTARKILSALDRMSSPIQDANKFPSSAGNVTFSPLRQKGLTVKNITSSSYKSETSFPPARSLSTRRPLSVQSSSMRAFGEPQTTTFPTLEKRPQVSVSTFRTKGLPTSFSPEDHGKAGGKMKRQRTTGHYSSSVAFEEEQTASLPQISDTTPLVIDSLPKINFSSSGNEKTPLTTSKSAVANQTRTGSSPSFSFSSSIVNKNSDNDTEQSKLTETADNKTVSSVKFDFAHPSAVNKIASIPARNKDVNFKFSSPLAKVSESTATSVNITNTNKNMFGNKFSVAPGSWECGTCLVRNKETDTSCVACGSFNPKTKENHRSAMSVKSSPFANQSLTASSSKQEPKELESKTFSMKFASPTGSWECETCLLRNKPEDTKCVACQSEKSTNTSKPMPEGPATVDLKKKFAPTARSWECDACMVRNSEDNQTCVACGNSKPTGKLAPITDLKTKFSAPSGSWECDTCMLRNDKDKEACAACGTVHPGNKPISQPADQKNMGTLNFKFVVPSSGWECDTCMVMNNKDKSECVACKALKPGCNKPLQSSTSQFSSAVTANDSNPLFKFGSSSGTASGAPQFKFGGLDNGPSVKFGTDTQSDNKTFQFGTPFSTSFKFGTSTADSQTNSSFAKPTVQPTFLFGTPPNASKLPSDAPDKEKQGLFNAPSKPSWSFGVTEEALSNKIDPSSDSITDPTSSNKEKFTSIADAAKAGFLKVPGVNSAKDDNSSGEIPFTTLTPVSTQSGLIPNGPNKESDSQVKPFVFGNKTESSKSGDKLQHQTTMPSSLFSSTSNSTKPESQSSFQVVSTSENMSLTSSPFKTLPDTSTSVAPNVSLVFGQSSKASKETSSTAPTSTAMSQFGQSTSNTFSGFNFSQNKDSKAALSTQNGPSEPLFSFGKNEPVSGTQLFSSKPVTSTNGLDSLQSTGSFQGTSKLQFGQSAPKPSTATALFSFGSLDSTPLLAASDTPPSKPLNALPTFKFGAPASNTDTSQPKESAPFQFTSKSSDNTGGFNFSSPQGIVPKVQSGSAGGFNFTPIQGISSNPAKFQFGQQDPVNADSSFNFTAGMTKSSAPSTSVSSAATNMQAPSFNFSSKMSGVFGDSSSNSTTMQQQTPAFNFTGNQQNPPVSTPLFNFSGNQANGKSTSAFPASAPGLFGSTGSTAPPQMTLNFTGNQRNASSAPLFNFMGNQGNGDQPPTFSANSPASGPRKYKKAVRRSVKK